MLLSLSLITFGIYIGQEYPNIPSLKLIALQVFEYFQHKDENNTFWNLFKSES